MVARVFDYNGRNYGYLGRVAYVNRFLSNKCVEVVIKDMGGLRTIVVPYESVQLECD